VTSELGAEIARERGLTVFDTLTGFKYIGEKIAEFEMQGTHEFLFGYEESYGYLAGTFVRDKDAVIASLLIIEMAAFYKSQNLSLEEVLNKIYNQYGFYLESLKTITLPGLDGLKRINETMQKFKDTARILEQFPNLVTIEDYEKQVTIDVRTGLNKLIELPKSDVLKFKLSDQSWFAVRPSGTEPKIKFYMSVLGSSEEDSANKLKELTEKLEQLC
jgi:phosphoglucomutase